MSIQHIKTKRDEAVAHERHVLRNFVKTLQVALDAYEADKNQVSFVGKFLKNGLTAHKQRVIKELRAILQEGEFSAQQKTIPVDAYTIRVNFAARLKQEDLSLFGLSGLADRIVVVLQHPDYNYCTLHQLRETSHQATAVYKKEKYKQSKKNNITQDAALVFLENGLLKEQQSEMQTQQEILSIQHVVSNFTAETIQTEVEQERQKNQRLEVRIERIEGLLNTLVEQNAQLQLSISNLQDENQQLKAENASYKRQLLEQNHSAYPGVLWHQLQASINTSDTSYELPLPLNPHSIRNEI